MPRPPRSQRPKVHKPSPLQQVHLTRPISHISNLDQPPAEMGLVRDPMFWKRFSTAIHDAEKGEVETVGRGSRSNSGSSGGTIGRAKHGDDWLAQQRKDKRRCRMICISITLLIIILIAAGAICGWYFTKGRKSS